MVSIDVSSKSPLFDLKVRIFSSWISNLLGYTSLLSITPDSNFLAEIILFNLGKFGRIDVNVDYTLVNQENNIIFAEQEVVAVETQTSFVREFKIPEGSAPGNYIFNVKISYFDGIKDNVQTSSTWVRVKNKYEYIIIYPIIIIIILILISVIFYLKVIRKNSVKRQRPKSERHIFKVLKRKVKPFYNPLKRKIKRSHIHDMTELRSKLKYWKRKGYNVSHLERFK